MWVRNIENVLENSACLLPAGVHSDESVAGAGSRGVAVFTKGDLGGISKRRGVAVLAPMQVCGAQGFGVL